MYQPGSIIPWVPGEVVLRFLPDGKIYVESVTEKTCIPPKRIDISDLEKALTSSFVQKRMDVEFRTGVLPKGTIEVVAVTLNDNLGHLVVIERKKCIAPFVLHVMDREPLSCDVGYPRLLFKFAVFAGKVKSLQIRAAKEGPLQDDTPLYYYPYTNVYHDGNVCMGTYKYPPVKEFWNLNTYPDIFYRLPNSTDLYNRPGITLRELIEFNREREFDDSLLEPCGETYGQFARRMPNIYL